MDRYEIILEELQDRVDCGMLTLEEAEVLNDLAYEKYYGEATRLTKEYNRRQSEYRNLDKKDKELAKRKIKGMNPRVLYGDDDNSLLYGRKLAKEISDHRKKSTSDRVGNTKSRQEMDKYMNHLDEKKKNGKFLKYHELHDMFDNNEFDYRPKSELSERKPNRILKRQN